MNTGLLLVADEEAELAGGMAHEVAHVAARPQAANDTGGPCKHRVDPIDCCRCRNRLKANHLSAFEEQAAQVSLDAETVRSLSQDHHSNWQSHVYYLNNLREGVNSMGKLLAELEERKSQGSEAQQMAVQRSRPHLVALAAETTEALNLLRARSGNVIYKETVADLSRQADILYQTVDAIVNYHNADDRLDKLEASHGGSGI